MMLLAFILFCWTLFGSFHVKEVIGRRCGPEMVVPCIMYDVTREVDILDTYRPYATSATGLVFIISAVIFLAHKKHNKQKV